MFGVRCLLQESSKECLFLKKFYWDIVALQCCASFCFTAVNQLYEYMCAVLNCARLFVIPQTVAHQAPLSMGILQARKLKWVAMPSFRGSSQPRDQTQVSCVAGDSLLSEPPGKPMNIGVSGLSLLQGIFPT